MGDIEIRTDKAKDIGYTLLEDWMNNTIGKNKTKEIKIFERSTLKINNTISVIPETGVAKKPPVIKPYFRLAIRISKKVRKMHTMHKKTNHVVEI